MKAEIDIAKAKRYCRVDDPAYADKRRSIQLRVEDLAFDAQDNLRADGAEKLRIAAAATGKTDLVKAATTEQAWEQVSILSDHLLTLCSATGIDAFEAALTNQGVL